MSLFGMVVVALASCSLPPREAWTAIQDRGLISYYMTKSNGGPLTSEKKMVTQTVAPVKTTPVVSSTTYAPGAGQLPVAKPAANMPGYVRSPYTSPPRLVDVRGMSAGSKVVCPYTQKPFLVPGAVVESSPRVVASEPRSTPPSSPRTSISVPVPAQNTNVAAMTRPTPPEPKLEPQPTTQVAPPTSTASDLPYGNPIPGRPGFVNSPYAARHQLVDVTGLPTGMEVKCPYTGKLFRVPPQ